MRSVLPASGAPLRALLVNQGAVGSTVLGHLATERSLRVGLAGTGVDARFLRLPPWGPAARLAAHRIPRLYPADLDLHELRWHVAESVRGRRAIRAALGTAPPDVVHVNTHTAGLLLGSLPARVPVFLAVDVPVREWHAMASPARAWSDASMAPSGALERAAFGRAAAVLTYSDWATDAVRRRCPGARVRTLHPGLDLERFAPAPREERSRPRVLFVGGRFAEKGGDDLLGALDGRLGRDVELDVVTGEPAGARDGLRVHRLAGEDPRLLSLFQQADVLCLPTRVDAMPWTLLEAMACGTPVVSTSVGGITELLGDGGAGRLVPPGDVPALRQALDALLGDPALRAAAGARARAIAEERFDARVQGRRLADCFAAAVAARPRAGAVA